MQVLKKKPRWKKIVDGELTPDILRSRIGSGKYGVSAWIRFSEHMMKLGFTVKLYEAPRTFSKYITVIGANDVFYKVRFSDHRPILHRELNGDCDFFVGVTNLTITNWTDAVRATIAYFNMQ